MQADGQIGWLRLACIGGLLVGCFTILRPFVAPLIWATVLAVSCWPGFRRLRGLLGERAGLAAWVFALAGMAVLLLPLVAAGLSAARHAPDLLAGIERVRHDGLPRLPEALTGLPVVGGRLAQFWAELSGEGTAVLSRYGSEIRLGVGWLAVRAGSFTLTLVQFALAIILAALCLARAERAQAILGAIERRIGGSESGEMMALAARTIRAVSIGVVGGAFVEGVLSAVGLAIAGVPGSALLGVATFASGILQLGPGVVFLPVAAWVWWHDGWPWALFVLAWHLALVVPVAMFGGPGLMSNDTGLPMVLVLFGVLGGMLAFGFIGIFLGPTVLAVSYTLALRWLGLGARA